MKKISQAIVFLGVLSCGFSAFANNSYVYRQRINFVKISSIPGKELSDMAPNHPYPKFTEAQMKSMLLSLQLSRKHVIKKDVDQQQIFSEDEAEKFAPYLVQAFQQVNPDERIVLSVVQKRPFFILRNDLLTMADLWVEGDNLHVRFKKVYAKLTGDYEAAGQQERLMKLAKGINFSLEAGPGQRLSDTSTQEVLLDTQFDYVGWWASVPRTADGEAVPVAERKAPEESSQTASSTPASKASKTPKERLQELDALKKDGLITQQEYNAIRQSILNGL